MYFYLFINISIHLFIYCLDPLQFAYREGRGTEDAVVTVTHLISKHLKTPKAHARVLFADFSSAFDTLRPHLLVHKLIDMGVNPYITKWFYSLLTNRSQQVKVNGSLSVVKHCSTGVPQGSVSSPVLFTTYTNGCKSSHPNNYIIKFSDDTIILSLLKENNCQTVYHKEIANFQSWCVSNHLILNTAKTKEMILDPTKIRVHHPVVIEGSMIEQVNSYKYLGVFINSSLKWSTRTEYLCGKLCQRIHFLRRLRLFGVCRKIMKTFYNAVLRSLITYGMTAWYGVLTVQLKTKIEKIVKIARTVVGEGLPLPPNHLRGQSC